MFEFIKERNLSEQDKEVYLWFKEKRNRQYLAWQGNMKKDSNIIFEKDISKIVVQGRNDAFNTKWKHKVYGEISDVNHFWSQIDSIYTTIQKTLLNRTFYKKRELIKGKILFLKTALNAEKKQVLKNYFDFEKFRKKIDKKFKGNNLLTKNQSAAGSITRANTEIHHRFFDLLNWVWHVLEEIEEKLSEIKY